MSMPYINIPPPYQPQQFNSHNVTLHVRQQPVQALVALESKERSRKPVDPPPILQMDVNPSVDPSEQWLVSPYFFVLVVLLEGAEGEEIVNSKELIGQTSSSLHKLKDVNNRDGGFFIFGDLSIRKIGRHRMRFNLFNTDKNTGQANFVCSVDSKPFDVLVLKDFRGLKESTHLSRTFADQGVRLRLRKEPRTVNVKRGYQSPDSSSHDPYSQDTPSVKRLRSESDHGIPRALAGYTGGGHLADGEVTGAGQRPPRLVPALPYGSAHDVVRPHFSSELPQTHYALHGAEHMVQSLGNSWTKSQLHANLSAPVESSENFHFGLNVAPIRSNYIGSEYNPFPSTHVRAQPALFGAGATLQHPSQIPNTLSTSTAGYLPASEYGGHSGGFSAHNPAPQQNYYGEQPVVPPRASRPVTSEPSLHVYHPPPSSLALQFSELPDRVPQFSDISHFSSAPSVQAPGPVNHTVPSVSHYGTTPLGASVLNSGWESEHYRATERTERSRAPAVGQQTLSGALNDDDGASQQQPPPAVYGGLQPQPKTYHRPSR